MHGQEMRVKTGMLLVANKKNPGVIPKQTCKRSEGLTRKSLGHQQEAGAHSWDAQLEAMLLQTAHVPKW